MPKSKYKYAICNPKAFFQFGCYIAGYYSKTDEFGLNTYSMYSNVAFFSSLKKAQAVLETIKNSECYIVKIDASEENE